MFRNPYESLACSGQWLKTNFHTHAGTGSDTCGHNELQSVVNAYADAGYGLLCISNHDVFTDCRSFTDERIMLINGFEYSATPHMLLIGGRSCILKGHQESILDAKAEGAFAVLCHPNWTKPWYWPKEMLDTITGYIGIEVINQLIYRLTGSGLACDVWDHLLSQGKRVFGFAHDDFHRWMDLGRSFTCLYSPSRDEDAVKETLHKGCFFASTGLFLDRFEFDGQRLAVAVRYPDINLLRDYRYRFVGKNGEILFETEAPWAEYHMRGDELYVRVEATGENGFMLLTQPVYDEDLFTTP